MSPKAAGLAKKWGWNHVRAYNDGMPAWKKGGNYTVSTADYVRTGNIVLIDLRAPAAVAAGHIPKAVGIPANQLESAKDKFPDSLTAPIVFYSDNVEESIKAVKTARSWRYKNVTLLEFPGAVEWQKKGYDVKTGPAAAEIIYVRKLDPGEISISDFEAALKTQTIPVIDVRAPSEYAAGHFSGAVNISLDDLPAKLDQIPKDKFVVVHCSTGIRGEMAYLLLKEKGYNVKYLKAGCKCNLDGTYLIWEL
ncbi:MAG: Rhodanese [Thermodesulfobacteriota bacterium]|nr:Rhodanese [Thermodesulfobacteriota bacterium]